MKTESIIIPKGEIFYTIEFSDGSIENKYVKNTVLRKGRNALASSLANQIGDRYEYFISRMIFGSSGTSGGVPKFVNEERNGLFGITQANKTIISNVDPQIPYQSIFTSVLTFQEANGVTLNEMALVMNNGDLYSMATFPDLNKTSQMQITWNWRLSFV